jgi:hypothetical protein
MCSPQVIVEAILVGVYSIVIYLCLAPIFRPFPLLLFFVGFVKHIAGYLLNIHTMYCNCGEACKESRPIDVAKESYVATAEPFRLFAESVLEGGIYLVAGIFLFLVLRNKWAIVFAIGTALHILSEWAGVHRQFCQHRCISLMATLWE